MPSLPARVRRIVLKLGTGTLTSGVGQLDVAKIAALGREAAAWRQAGIEVVIVSSGAVGLGMGRLGLAKRPTKVSSLQKCAAVGQSILIETWQRAFNPFKLTVAQLLLTRDNVASRSRHLAVKDLIEEILADGLIPIINENDSVSVEELKFGDNDMLSALVASLVDAELLILLSTTPGLVDRKGTGKVVPVVERITADIEAMAGGTESATAVGGMISKLTAAKIAARSGCGVIIASGDDPAILPKLLAGRGRLHLFRSRENPARFPQALARLVPASRRDCARGCRRRTRFARTGPQPPCQRRDRGRGRFRLGRPPRDSRPSRPRHRPRRRAI